MCERRNCRHNAADLCTCMSVKDRAENILLLIRHVSTNMENVEWELDYTDLNRPEERRLCLVGACRVCGGRLCHEMDASDALAGDDFLAALYRHLYQVHNSDGRYMSSREFRERFVRLFHTQDQPFIQSWLERPENKSVHTMYRKSAAIGPGQYLPIAPAGQASPLVAQQNLTVQSEPARESEPIPEEC